MFRVLEAIRANTGGCLIGVYSTIVRPRFTEMNEYRMTRKGQCQTECFRSCPLIEKRAPNACTKQTRYSIRILQLYTAAVHDSMREVFSGASVSCAREYTPHSIRKVTKYTLSPNAVPHIEERMKRSRDEHFDFRNASERQNANLQRDNT